MDGERLHLSLGFPSTLRPPRSPLTKRGVLGSLAECRNHEDAHGAPKAFYVTAAVSASLRRPTSFAPPTRSAIFCSASRVPFAAACFALAASSAADSAARNRPYASVAHASSSFSSIAKTDTRAASRRPTRRSRSVRVLAAASRARLASSIAWSAAPRLAFRFSAACRSAARRERQPALELRSRELSLAQHPRSSPPGVALARRERRRSRSPGRPSYASDRLRVLGQFKLE